ncbi:P-loop containing nucleoside triphosphate hydrolase protein [Staphylotrichum tortipilum]|uniref:P-loop containing nucleoside triphosphate hydrolase protein n=1 Tax=Staphylotrichum tortipilum TaxID=2831512 RepID=A0AAN6MJI6_9PEZI|nr:P-loop containing nucleoside triphosphate hydrolase protein [Staphylotrichum longicolle]
MEQEPVTAAPDSALGSSLAFDPISAIPTLTPAQAHAPAANDPHDDDTLEGIDNTMLHQAVPDHPFHNMHDQNGYHDRHHHHQYHHAEPHQPMDHGVNSSPRSHYPADNTDGEPTARYATPPNPVPPISRPPSGLSGHGAAYGADHVSRAGSNGASADSQPPKRNSVVIKVGMVGDAQIGKTSLMVKYVEGSWDEDYIQTLGVNFMEKTISIRNTEITFSIWDLGGQREFVNMLPLVCNDAVAILFMFDLTRKSTLNSIKEWYRQGRGFNKIAIPVLVGTKYDHFVNLAREEQEEISNQARRFAKAMRAALVFSSTSHSINVQKIFKIVISKAFDLKCTIPEITNVGEPLLIYQSC